MDKETVMCFLARIALCAAAALEAASAHAGVGDQLHKLLANDGDTNDQFGYAVAVSGTIAVVGAQYAGSGGSAYLCDTTTGAQLTKLLPTDGTAHLSFGQSVAIDGTIAVVGANGHPDTADVLGKAYLFDTTTGAQIGRLTAADGTPGDYFGVAVGISGTTAIVGANGDDNVGAAYLFDTTTGAQIAKLTPADGAIGDSFGRAVAIDGAIAIVGALNDDDNGFDSGSVYLFDATTGAQLNKLLPDYGEPDERFGCAVAIDGGAVVIGAFGDNDNGPYSGSAYVFDAATGTQLAKLRAPDGRADDRFGTDVGVSGDILIVGAPWDDDSGAFSGSAYLFDTSGNHIAKLQPLDGAPNDEYGWAVAIDGITAVVGAYGDDDNGSSSGSAYVHRAITPCSPADVTTQGAPIGDPNDGVPDGIVSAADIQYYVNLWIAGCP